MTDECRSNLISQETGVAVVSQTFGGDHSGSVETVGTARAAAATAQIRPPVNLQVKSAASGCQAALGGCP